MPKGPIAKLQTSPTTPIDYRLPVGNERIPLNERLGERLSLRFLGAIECVHCGREIKKSFQQGYCYPCFRSLARCDSCLVRPELCHFDAGTCREPDWGRECCLIPHSVYLANSSGLKVGITRGLEPFGRWADQGAVQGLVIRLAATRLEAGRIEVSLKQHVADRTNWRKMLKGEPEPLDLKAERDRLFDTTRSESLAGSEPKRAEPLSLHYPVQEYPAKVISHDLTKQPLLEGTLLGIKGQYLLLDTAVINIHKHGGFVLEVR